MGPSLILPLYTANYLSTNPNPIPNFKPNPNPNSNPNSNSNSKEKIQNTYIKQEQRVLAAKLLREDMKNGGKGDLGVSFHK
jgi:hypothetical protein